MNFFNYSSLAIFGFVAQLQAMEPEKQLMLFNKYTPEGQLTKDNITNILKAQKLSFDLFAETQQAFKNKEVAKFDPLISDTQCQFRVPQVCECFNKSSLFSSGNLDSSKISTLVSQIDKNPMLKKKILAKKTVGTLFKEENIELPLSSDEQFLTAAYFLTKYKETTPDKVDRLNKGKLALDSGLSVKLAQELLEKTQTFMQNISINTIQQKAVVLGAQTTIFPPQFVPDIQSSLSRLKALTVQNQSHALLAY